MLTCFSIVVGALQGRFAEVFPKLAALHAKNNFAFAVLVGDVFGASPDALSIDALLRNEIPLALPTYFTLGTHELPASIRERVESNNGEVCENLFFLGKKGSLKTNEGIRIVAVGGTWDASLIAGGAGESTQWLPFYTAADIASLKGQNYADVLISTDWPAGVEKHAAAAPVAHGKGSEPLADLARALRPRYHFCAGGDVFYEREPYRNDMRRNESAEDRRVTRFYSLADWGNAAKSKAIFAFSIDITTPSTSAANSTASPYPEQAEAGGARKRAAGAEGTFFWGDHTSGGQHQHQHKRRNHQPRPPPGPENCFFCLSYPQLEKHLIVSIGDESYLTTAKGPLTSPATNPDTLPFSAHILIIPFSHTPTIPLIEDPESRAQTLAEMKRYKSALEKMLASRGAGAVTFEIRRRNGVHAHWQVVPLKTELLEAVDTAFDAAGKFEDVEVGEDGSDVNEDGDAFTYWVSGREGARALRLGADEYFDLQFGRRVLAGVLGTGGVNWRDCVLGLEEEKKDAAAFKEAFKEFDFSLE